MRSSTPKRKSLSLGRSRHEFGTPDPETSDPVGLLAAPLLSTRIRVFDLDRCTWNLPGPGERAV